MKTGKKRTVVNCIGIHLAAIIITLLLFPVIIFGQTRDRKVLDLNWKS